jgi:two-component system nitrate/nitrite sensor histidine kinase NarX
VPVWTPGELLGDLWLGRKTGEAFSERDRRYLMTLAGIAAIAITAARLRENERQGAILSERDRIARELHDSLAQVLGSTHLRLRALLARPELDPTGRLTHVAAELGDLADVAEDAYRDVREAILGLREASHARGLIEGLGAYLAKFSQQSGIQVELESALDGEPALTTSSEIQLIRVIQEALTNVRKHSQASRAWVKLMGAPDDPRLEGTHREGGYGLQTMRERMELAGGTLRIDSRPGHGTRIMAIVPEVSNAERPAPVPEER